MRLTRIYQPGSYQTGDIVLLDESASHHLGVVLRAKPGDPLFVFPGDQSEFKASITTIKKKQVTIQIEESIQRHAESPLRIHVAQAICKGDKMDWILQKGTELGVQIFTPLISSRSSHELANPQRREKKMKHWEGVIIHASEQCGRNQLPTLHQPVSLEDFLVGCKSSTKWILDPEAKQKLSQTSPPQNDITVLIGPEGGWSELELSNALQSGFHPVCLGPRTLRAESASIAIISALQVMAGDF